jgi:hypothetical protein
LHRHGGVHQSAEQTLFSGTRFSLCGFDLWQAKVKRTQAEAYATGAIKKNGGIRVGCRRIEFAAYG